ncbi:MAG: hypothetical protein AAF628_27670 [Planctomycetota bacterium]
MLARSIGWLTLLGAGCATPPNLADAHGAVIQELRREAKAPLRDRGSVRVFGVAMSEANPGSMLALAMGHASPTDLAGGPAPQLEAAR